MRIAELFKNGSAPAPSCRAIEIGTTAIRMVALKGNGKRPRLTDLQETAIPRKGPGPAPPGVVLERLRSLVRGTGLKEEVVCTALPIHRVFVRSLDLPFSRSSQIRQVIASEAELHVPFPLEQILIDFWPVEELEGGKTRVIMMAAKKTVLEDHLRMLADAGIDPTRVSVDLLGSCRAYTASPLLPSGEVTILLEIGAVHTGVAFLLGGTVVSLRSFSWGGDTVTAAIMEEMGCGFIEAEAMKVASSPEAGLRDRIAGACSAAFSRLESELMRTMSSAIPATGGESARNLILTGGACEQSGLKEYLSRKFDLELLELDPFEGVNSRKVSDHPAAARTGLGLALSEVTPTRDRVDFRRDEFAFAGSWKKIRRRLFVTAGLMVGVIAMLAMSLFWKIRLEGDASRNLARQIRTIVLRTFPDNPVPEEGDELKAMKEGVEQSGLELKYYHDLVAVSALDILREISRVIPDSISVQVVILDIDGKRVLFRGRTNSYRSADLIKNALAKSDLFQGDKIRESKDVKTLKKGGQVVTVEFEYNIPIIFSAKK